MASDWEGHQLKRANLDYCLHSEKGVTVKVCQKALCRVHAFGPRDLWVLRDKIASADEGGITFGTSVVDLTITHKLVMMSVTS